MSLPGSTKAAFAGAHSPKVMPFCHFSQGPSVCLSNPKTAMLGLLCITLISAFNRRQASRGEVYKGQKNARSLSMRYLACNSHFQSTLPCACPTTKPSQLQDDTLHGENQCQIWLQEHGAVLSSLPGMVASLLPARFLVVFFPASCSPCKVLLHTT